MEEWDVYDINRRPTGKIICRDKAELQNGEYHLVVDVWIVNAKHQFLIQKRALSKKAYPGKWAQSAGGAVIRGEDSFEGCLRETQEELGIDLSGENVELAYSFIRHGNTIVDVYLVYQDIDISDIILEKGEVDEVRWADFDEINKLLEEGRFVPSVMEGLHGILQNNVVLQEKYEPFID